MAPQGAQGHPGPTRGAQGMGWHCLGNGCHLGTCLSLPCCACRRGAGGLPPFAGLFRTVGPRLQDWVEALRAIVGGSPPAPTVDRGQLPGETWLFLQVCGEGWAGGSPCPSDDSATRDRSPAAPLCPLLTSLGPIVPCAHTEVASPTLLPQRGHLTLPS